MAVYLITYDLNKETIRPDIVSAIKKYPRWARLSESSYAVVTTMSASDIYDRFKKYLDNNDSFYAIQLTYPYDGQGPKEVNDWLASNL